VVEFLDQVCPMSDQPAAGRHCRRNLLESLFVCLPVDSKFGTGMAARYSDIPVLSILSAGFIFPDVYRFLDVYML